MATFLNQGSGRNLTVQMFSTGGPYTVMTVGLPVQYLFGFEPAVVSSAEPDLVGNPPWGAQSAKFKQDFARVVSDAWSKKYPLYGARRAGTTAAGCGSYRLSQAARELGFADYSNVKVDVSVQVYDVPLSDRSAQRANRLLVLRLPRTGRKRYISNGSWRNAAAMVYEDNVLPATVRGFRHVVAAHEAGHLLGFEHIGENEPGCGNAPGVLLDPNRGNQDACYMQHGTWSSNIMGVGMEVTPDQYRRFAGMLDTILPEFVWRVENWGAAVRIGR